MSTQDHLQAKTSSLWHSTVTDSDDNLPPGFEGPQPRGPQIPLIKWQCPPRLILNPEWLVVAGDESKEVEVQNQRQLRVLEAVYPRPSAIPPSPSVSSEAHDYYLDDLHTPLIPIMPVEEDDTSNSFDSTPTIHTTVIPQQPALPKSFPEIGTPPQLIDFRPTMEQSQGNAPTIPKPTPLSEKASVGILPSVEPDVIAAASAAFTAIMRSTEQGSLIDRDLLIKILANPTMIEQLVSEHIMPTNPQITPKPMPIPTSLSGLQPPKILASPTLIEQLVSEHRVPANPQIIPKSMLMPTSMSGLKPPNVSIMASESPSPVHTIGHLYPIPNTSILNPRPPPITVQVTTKAHVVKDINYYKSLVQQHGEEKNEVKGQTFMQFNNRHPFGVNLETIQSLKQRDSIPKILKPCLYFHSSMGCRHGSNCQFQHDLSFKQPISSMPEGPSLKRIKMESEITGRS
ncbi:zinc finger CCCH domain-containing protein 6-like isoform X2 [Tasmannia lanceolata]